MKAPLAKSGSLLGQLALLAATLIAVWLSVAIHLRQQRVEAADVAAREAGQLALAYEAAVSRSIANVDRSLVEIRDGYAWDQRNFNLTRLARTGEPPGEADVHVSVIDISGRVVAESRAGAVPEADVAEVTSLIRSGSATDKLLVDQPADDQDHGQPGIRLTRVLIAADGAAAGAVVAVLDPRGLMTLPGPVDRAHFAMLLGRDGAVLVVAPDTTMSGEAVDPAIFPEIAGTLAQDAASGSARTVSRDNAIVSYRPVAGYPLGVAVGIPGAAAFASYLPARRNETVVGACLTVVVVCAGYLMIRRWRRLTRSHDALSATLEHVGPGILMIDARRRMPVVNRQVTELLGLPDGLAVPGADYDTMAAWLAGHGVFRPDKAADQPGLASPNDAGVDRDTTCYERTRADGTVVEVRTRVLPDESAVRTFTDVTERRRLEREIVRSRDIAEAGMHARTEFLAVMGHEIRTPMNGIIGATGLLQQMQLSVEQFEYVRIIRDSTEQLSALIQNMLDFSRLEAGAMELDDVRFDPRDTIETTIAMLDGQARTKGLYLDCAIQDGIPRDVMGDPSRLRQVLVNLISNGIRFTDAGGISVDVRLVGGGDRTVTIGMTVKDTGRGIEPEKLDGLFSVFGDPGDPAVRRLGGPSLGLAISKHLIALMGGTIDVTSAVGQGSAFNATVRFRRLATTEPRAEPANAAPSAGGHLKILLAEDNPTNRHVALRMLTRMAHEVDAVEDGKRAVSAATAADYDVVLMDVMMPEVDGIAATKAIRAGVAPRSDVYIIGLTANATPADRAACMTAGMNDFVTKPITMERLQAALEEAIKRTNRMSDPRAAADAELLDSAFLAQLADEIGPDGVAEIIHIFLEDAPLHVATIRRAIAEGAMQTARREAHGLAGAARTVGLTRLANAAAALHKPRERSDPGKGDIDTVANILRDSLPLVAAWAEGRQAPTATAA